MHTDINKQIIKKKLEKIKEAEQKLEEYELKYKEIKSGILGIVLKGLSSFLFTLSSRIVALAFLIVGIALFFPKSTFGFLEANDFGIPMIEENEIIFFSQYLKYFFLILSVVFGLLGYTLKMNFRKSLLLDDLSVLLEEIIQYLRLNNEEEKKRYEYYVDNLAEEKQKEDSSSKKEPEPAS